MPRAKKTAAAPVNVGDVCVECFVDGPPEAATAVGCEHGQWVLDPDAAAAVDEADRLAAEEAEAERLAAEQAEAERVAAEDAAADQAAAEAAAAAAAAAAVQG